MIDKLLPDEQSVTAFQKFYQESINGYGVDYGNAESICRYFMRVPATGNVRMMRETLEFYANPENWKWIAKPTDTDHILDCGSEVQRDFGERARTALSAEARDGDEGA